MDLNPEQSAHARSMMPRWGVDYACAAQWYFFCFMHSYFARSIIIPWRINGVSGIICAASTKISNTRQNEARIAGKYLHNLGWFFYDCYWYPGLSMLNWAGMTDPLYCGNGQPLPQNLAQLIDMYVANSDLQNWRETYGTHHGGAEYYEGLRRLLRVMQKSVWIELVSGYSREVYGGLDVYVRLVSCDVFDSVPEEDVHFLVWDVEKVNPMDRWLPAPFDWYTFQHWFSMGQKPQGFADEVEDLRMHLARGDPAAQRRMQTLSAHVANQGRYSMAKAMGKGSRY